MNGPDGTIDVGRLYREHRLRVFELLRGLPDSATDVPCPACPGWTVHDVVSHLAGIVADALAGRLSGPPGEEQTAAQVAERRDRSTAEVLDEWAGSVERFEQVLTEFGPGFLPAAIDLAVHEHDIRGALGLAGRHDSETVTITAARMLDGWSRRLRGRGLDLPAVVTPDGELLAGDAGSVVRWTASRYEVVRAVFGRRSAAQFAAAFDGGDPAPYLDALLAFGITATDLCD